MSLRERLRLALEPQQWQLILTAGKLAVSRQMPIYLVGGGVRDLMLGLPLTDVDIVVVGDAILLAEQVARRSGGRVHTHDRFGTAKWLPDNGASVDFITARREHYPAPAALPEVSAGNIGDDLRRRDFTINTLAIRVDGSRLGELIDIFRGEADLAQRQVRVLHQKSFIDDPTRIFRAVRYEQRLGFEIEPHTLQLLHEGISTIQLLTPARVRHELEHVLAESQRSRMLARLEQLGVLAALHPQLCWHQQTALHFERLAQWLLEAPWACSDVEALYWLLWLGSRPRDVQCALVDRLNLSGKVQRSLRHYFELQHILPTIAPDAPPSTVERQLRPFSPDVTALTAARIRYHETHIANWIDRYMLAWRTTRTALSGRDLIAAGLSPGPQFQQILDELRAGRLDGVLKTVADERRLLAQLYRKVD